MNKTLIRAAAVITLVAASITFFACSGEDGAAGPAGQAPVCTGVPVTGGLNIVCDGVVVGNLSDGQDATGAAGSCTITLIGATGSFNARCDGQNYVIGGGGTGSCTITESGLDNEYLVFNCGGTPARIAKAWCGATPYNDSRKACVNPSTGELSDFVCGIEPWDKAEQFCANDGVKDSVHTFCGPELEEYDPKTHFCLDKLQSGAGSAPTIAIGSSNNEVVPLCGANLKFRGGDQFCQALTAGGTRVMDKCGTSVYDEYSLCVSGELRGSCNQVAFDPGIEFCQGGTTVKELCINTLTPKADTLKYEANEFCASGYVLGSSGDTKQNQVYTRCSGGPQTSTQLGSLKVSTNANGEGAVDQGNGSFDPLNYFCQGTGTTKAKIIHLCGSIAPTSNTANPGFDGQYLETQFCGNSWETATSPNTTPVILPRCGNGEVAFDFKAGTTMTASDVAPGAKDSVAQGSGSYNGLAGLIVDSESDGYYCKGSVKTKLAICGSGTYNGFNQDKSFCVGVTPSAGKSYPLCGLSAPATQPTADALAPYNPSENVCDTRENKLYAYAQIGFTKTAGTTKAVGTKGGATGDSVVYWLLENVSYAGKDGDIGKCYGNLETNCTKYGRLYTNSEAVSVCAGIGSGATGDQWAVPDSIDFAALLQEVDGSTSGLKAATGWTPASGTDDVDFAALPGGKGSYTPTTGNTYDQESYSAFWWSRKTNSNISSLAYAAGITFNSDNFLEVVNDPTLGTVARSFNLNKVSDFLSARCVKVPSVK